MRRVQLIPLQPGAAHQIPLLWFSNRRHSNLTRCNRQLKHIWDKKWNCFFYLVRDDYHIVQNLTFRGQNFPSFCWTANVFLQISKCFGTCGHCFDAKVKVFLWPLTWWANHKSFLHQKFCTIWYPYSIGKAQYIVLKYQESWGL